MNPDIIIKKHLQVLGGIIVLWFLFADDMIQQNMPKDIKRFKSTIRKYTEEKRKFEDLIAEKNSVRGSIEESNENLRDLFDRFPKEGTAENNINATVTKITEQIIVQNDQLKPKVTIVSQWTSSVKILHVAVSGAAHLMTSQFLRPL